MRDPTVISAAPGEPIEVFAVFVGDRIDVKLGADRIGSGPPMYAIGADQVVALFRYGVAVFFNTDPELRDETLGALEITRRFEAPEIESTSLVVDSDRFEGPDGSTLSLKAFTLTRLQAVAEVLAKSVVLAHHEQELARVFVDIEPLANEMAGAGKLSTRNNHLIKHIGRTLTIQHRMVGRVEIPEKPEFLWENPEHDRLYLRLEDEFELRERHLALERKLALIANTAETLLELLQARRSLRVEYYIVALIAFEIGIYLWDLFLR